jgi:hypothetical protein
VKTIVTADVVYTSSHGSFASWDDLYQSADVRKSWEPLHISAGPEVVPGWKLSLVASGDGQSFQIALLNIANKCWLSVFRSQDGRIYEGGSVDCVQLVPPRP